MRKSLALLAIIVNIVLLTAFSAQAAEGIESVGHGVMRLMNPTQSSVQQSKLLIIAALVREGETVEPLGQAKRKDTTSVGISRSAVESKKNSSETVAPETSTRLGKKQGDQDSKFGIYNTIKESVLDFFLPSRKKAAEKIDLSKLHRDGKTEAAKSAFEPQPVK